MPGSLLHAYWVAKARVTEAGYGAEIVWQDARSVDDVSEQDFLREAAWVVLSSGMREAVIRSKFERISEAFCDWQSASLIHKQRKRCADQAHRVFAHRRKIDAILTITEHVATAGFARTHRRLRHEGAEFLRGFPYLGPATALHLAKNLGVDVAKPDRHLIRVAAATGFASPDALCTALAEASGDKKSVVDLVIWRLATIDPDYVEHFAAKATYEEAVNGDVGPVCLIA